jgi:hypothetical protein
MPRFARILLLIAAVIATGAGCFGAPVDYVKAPPSRPPDIKPNPAGARASTGGYEATITPSLATELLVASLPDAAGVYQAGIPVERQNPVPLPDGTAATYPSITVDYSDPAVAGRRLNVTVTDTRGLPVLLAFLEGFNEYRNDTGARYRFDIAESAAWLSFTYESGGGSGSVIVAYRKRFIIQIDGTAGIAEDELIRFAESFNYDKLR